MFYCFFNTLFYAVFVSDTGCAYVLNIFLLINLSKSFWDSFFLNVLYCLHGALKCYSCTKSINYHAQEWLLLWFKFYNLSVMFSVYIFLNIRELKQNLINFKWIRAVWCLVMYRVIYRFSRAELQIFGLL